MQEENIKNFSAQKQLVINSIIEKIKEKEPVKPDVLMASITIEDPFLSQKRAEHYILAMYTLGKIQYNGDGCICLTK